MSADHIEPPLLPGLCGKDVSVCPTPFIKRVKERGYFTYAFDQAAAVHPGIRAQTAIIIQNIYDTYGVQGYEVSSGPDLWLTMPSDATFLNVCGDGASGCIEYWLQSVMVYFRRALPYNADTGWLTTIAHEIAHAFGLHERYDDREFKCITNPQPPTVMSCGSGIWRLTAFDREWILYVLLPEMCSAPLSPEQRQIAGCVVTYPYFDGARWHFEDGWAFEPATGAWFNPAGVLEWQTPCASWGGCWNDVIKRWVAPDGAMYDPATNIWSRKP